MRTPENCSKCPAGVPGCNHTALGCRREDCEEHYYLPGPECPYREIDRLRELVRQWEEKAKNWFATPEAQRQLEGYRNMGMQLAEKDRTIDKLRAELNDTSRPYIEYYQHSHCDTGELLPPTEDDVYYLRGNADILNTRWHSIAESLEEMDGIQPECSHGVQLKWTGEYYEVESVTPLDWIDPLMPLDNEQEL